MAVSGRTYKNGTPNLDLPQYTQDDKPAWLTDTNGAYLKIDEFAGEQKSVSGSNSQAITALQGTTQTNTQSINNINKDVSLIKTNQTAVNKHLTDVDTEITGLDTRIEALENGQLPDEVYSKSETDAKFATVETVDTITTSVNVLNTKTADLEESVGNNAESIVAINDQLTAGDAAFKFGVTEDGQYGYIKAGADTVIPFKAGGEIGVSFAFTSWVSRENVVGDESGRMNQMRNHNKATITLTNGKLVLGSLEANNLSPSIFTLSAATGAPQGELTLTNDITIEYEKKGEDE